MVESHPAALDAVFHALADPTRRLLLRRLAGSPRTVGELATPFAMSLAAISKHIKVLEAAGLLRRDVQGRTHTCYLQATPLRKAEEWIQFYARFWNERLDALEAALEAEDQKPATKTPEAARPLKNKPKR